MPIRWGPASLPRAKGTEHFLLVGASGSGKTTLLKMMLKSVFEPDRHFNGLVYDPKQELLPSLFGLRDDTAEMIEKGTSSVRVLNPFDKRCCAWDLSRDIDNPVSARQLATILVPDSKSGAAGEQFFTNAVRDILTTVILVFINCAREDCRWTFRDLLLGVLYRPYLNTLLAQTVTRKGAPFPIAYRTHQTYIGCGDPRTLDNILATISARLSVFEPIAASWHQAAKKGDDFTFSLTDWKDGRYSDVLVLGNDESGRASIDPINQAIFRRAVELLLSKSETTSEDKRTGENQTWFFLDEVREAGKLEGLGSLLTKGRSKGACVVLAFQDIEGLRDVYGAEVANEICGQCNNAIVLRLNSPTTASWASELFGRRIGLARSAGFSGISHEAGFQEQERPFYHTSDFTYLPTSGVRNGFSGYLKNPETNPDEVDARWNLTIGDVEAALPTGPQSESPAHLPFAPKDLSSLYLEPWCLEDWDRLGFSSPKGTTPGESEALSLSARLRQRLYNDKAT